MVDVAQIRGSTAQGGGIDAGGLSIFYGPPKRRRPAGHHDDPGIASVRASCSDAASPFRRQRAEGAVAAIAR